MHTTQLDNGTLNNYVAVGGVWSGHRQPNPLLICSQTTETAYLTFFECHFQKLGSI